MGGLLAEVSSLDFVGCRNSEVGTLEPDRILAGLRHTADAEGPANLEAGLYGVRVICCIGPNRRLSIV